MVCLPGVRFDACAQDDVSEETQFSGEEVGLHLVAVDTGFAEGLENRGTVLFVLLKGLGPDDNVVEVHMANLANVFS
jgi:hypothetical protein